MSDSKETASLCLRTYDIPLTPIQTPVDTDTIYGILSNNNQLTTWRNVNMKSVLGDLYYKYEKFNLTLTSVMVRHIVATPIVDAICNIYLSGLQFSNQGYSTRTGMTNQAIVGVNSFNASGVAGTATPISSVVITFYRPTSDLVDLIIELKNNSINEKSASVVGHQTYVFDIIGCDGYETKEHHLYKKNRL